MREKRLSLGLDEHPSEHLLSEEVNSLQSFLGSNKSRREKARQEQRWRFESQRTQLS
jgi:hypothetical protein